MKKTQYKVVAYKGTTLHYNKDGRDIFENMCVREYEAAEWEIEKPLIDVYFEKYKKAKEFYELLKEVEWNLSKITEFDGWGYRQEECIWITVEKRKEGKFEQYKKTEKIYYNEKK